MEIFEESVMCYLSVHDAFFRKSNECMRGIVTVIVSLVIGFFIGVSFPAFSPPKVCLTFVGQSKL